MAGRLNRYMVACNPQVEIRFSGTVPAGLDSVTWSDVAAALESNETNYEGGGVYLLHNHTSFFDATTAFACMSADCRVTSAVAALAKEDLWDHPLMGYVVRWTGQLPVYFTTRVTTEAGSDKDSLSFEVDKSKQAATAAAAAHLDGGGMIYVLPEGRINREDSSRLQPFRRGSFENMAARRCAVFALVTAGCDDVWPVREALGGMPGTIHTALVRITSGGDESEHTDAEALREHAVKTMQDTLDHLHALRKVELEEFVKVNRSVYGDRNTKTKAAQISSLFSEWTKKTKAE
jgi:1-acyl-sn-glycerol-3-phosphate acyltransferase